MSAVTAMSQVSCLGHSLEEFDHALDTARVGLNFNHRFQTLFPDVPLGSVAEAAFIAETPSLKGFDSRLIKIIVGSLTELLQRHPLFSAYQSDEIGVFIGTTTGGIESFSAKLFKAFQSSESLNLAQLMDATTDSSSITQALIKEFNCRGPIFVYSTACSSAAVAIKQARAALNCGMVKAALVGGFDVLAEVTIAGFDALQILAHKISQPLSPESSGMNLAEGGAWLFLEAQPKLTPPLAWIKGAMSCTDAHHLTLPQPQGLGMERAMRGALIDAGLCAADVGYLNAHGTGTHKNDSAELSAIERVFKGTNLHCTSSKGLHGHTLGGAGALEAVVTILELKRLKLRYGMSNSFGFGGTNVSLVFEGASLA